MKLKRFQLSKFMIIITIIIIILLIIVATILFFQKIKFSKLDQGNTQIITTATSELPLINKKISPRDPNLNNEQNLIKDYLSNHLSDLSSTKEVLGGKFYLTDIKFINNNQANISYEDGHIALQATVNYTLNEKELKITDFKITKKN